jgi:hypothetical protein
MAKAQNQEGLATPPGQGQFEPRAIRRALHLAHGKGGVSCSSAEVVFVNLSGGPGARADHGMEMCGNTGAEQEG